MTLPTSHKHIVFLNFSSFGSEPMEKKNSSRNAAVKKLSKNPGVWHASSVKLKSMCNVYQAAGARQAGVTK